MIAYKRYVTIQDPQQVILSDLPFRSGQRVEIVMIAEEDLNARVAAAQELFKKTQALPQARTLTDEEIAAEIEAYRASK
jgi:hypothetical protein